MSRTYNYKTDMDITIDGVTVDVDAVVTFAHYAGYNGDMTDPPEPATVELVDIICNFNGNKFPLRPNALLDKFNDALQNEMREFVQSLADEAADARYEGSRND